MGFGGMLCCVLRSANFASVYALIERNTISSRSLISPSPQLQKLSAFPVARTATCRSVRTAASASHRSALAAGTAPWVATSSLAHACEANFVHASLDAPARSHSAICAGLPGRKCPARLTPRAPTLEAKDRQLSSQWSMSYLCHRPSSCLLHPRRDTRGARHEAHTRRHQGWRRPRLRRRRRQRQGCLAPG